MHAADGYGMARVIEVEFVFRADDERRSIADLVERVRESGVFRAAPAVRRDYRVLLVEGVATA